MSTQTTGEFTGTANKGMILDSPLGGELSEAEAETLVGSVAVACLKEGDFLIEEGAINDTLYVIVSGKLEVVKCVGGGDCITLQLLHPGDMAGELGFIDGLEHSAGLRAIGDCVIFTLSRETLESLLATHPRIVYKVMRSIIRTVHGILRRMNIQHVEMTNYIAKQHGRY